MEIGQEVGSVACGRMHACVVNVNGLGKVEVPVLEVTLVEEALKVGQDSAVGALANTIAMGMVCGGAGFIDAPEAEKIGEDRVLEVRPLVRVDLHGRTKGEEPELLAGEENGLGVHVGEGDGYHNMVKRSCITAMTQLPRSLAGRAFDRLQSRRRRDHSFRRRRRGLGGHAREGKRF